MRHSFIFPVALATVMLGFTANPALAQWFGNSPNSVADSKAAALTSSNFSTTQNSLRSQINTAVVTGKIAPGTASALTSQLDQAQAMTQNALASGNLTNNAANSIMAVFTNVGNSLTSTQVAWPNQYFNQNANFYQNGLYPNNFYGNPYNNTNPYYGNMFNPYF